VSIDEVLKRVNDMGRRGESYWPLEWDLINQTLCHKVWTAALNFWVHFKCVRMSDPFSEKSITMDSLGRTQL
jgi:hypothetical protein